MSQNIVKFLLSYPERKILADALPELATKLKLEIKHPPLHAGCDGRRLGSRNNGYSLMEIESNGTIHLTGFRKRKSHDWNHDRRK